jgi:hypothetical protein
MSALFASISSDDGAAFGEHAAMEDGKIEAP